MSKSYLKLDPKVFQMASHLLGAGSVQENLVKNEDSLQDNCIIAVYPAIIEDAFSKTMDNYRTYIAKYNFQTTEENGLIRKFNVAVDTFCNKNKLSEVQLKFREIFIFKNLGLKPREYNEKVDEFSKEYGMIVQKRTIPTVKYQTEIIFQQLLHLYNSQLMKQNEKYMQARISVKRPLQEFKVNSYLVTSLKRNGVNSIDICTKTVRNHRQRLEEAGVFIHYHFAGRNRAVGLHINPEILVVLDIKTMKMQNVEKQPLTSSERKVLPDTNEKTRTLLNETEIKQNVENNSVGIRSSSEALTPFNLLFTGTHASKVEKSTEAAAEKNVKISPFSEKLRQLIIHPQELAQKLTENEFVNYKPIDIRVLFDEAYRGTMTKEEFRELAIQDFFKTISKIYKNSTPFVGSWKIAINLYYQSKWISFTNESHNKANIVDDISQMRWRAEWSRKWFTKHNQVTPLFPQDYFDFTRKTNKEVGFEYTKIKWNEHQQAISKYENLKKKQQKNAQIRKENINYAKKLETLVNRFYKNRITFSQLHDSVSRNFPPEYALKIPEMLEHLTLKDTRKTVQYDGKDFIKYSIYEL